MFKYALRVLFSCSAALRDYPWLEHGAGAVEVQAEAEVSIRIVVSVEVGSLLFGFPFFWFMSVFGFENGMLLAFARQSVNISIKSHE